MAMDIGLLFGVGEDARRRDQDRRDVNDVAEGGPTGPMLAQVCNEIEVDGEVTESHGSVGGAYGGTGFGKGRRGYEGHERRQDVRDEGGDGGSKHKDANDVLLGAEGDRIEDVILDYNHTEEKGQGDSKRTSWGDAVVQCGWIGGFVSVYRDPKQGNDDRYADELAKYAKECDPGYDSLGERDTSAFNGRNTHEGVGQGEDVGMDGKSGGELEGILKERDNPTQEFINWTNANVIVAKALFGGEVRIFAGRFGWF
ncbi:hypothetical protein BC938DRAFT_473957 [Jimgerdemannia flammicorona]|uniref:Uncharacterized protein n=1 Tax=Jimgerdemannia flammicorona TaxID=994334 RepID=A0A433Q308_9FUNG|nr:hypothetical protein BC938DRAFT_473957 [Jimgerdemannia flammicorona]